MAQMSAPGTSSTSERKVKIDEACQTGATFVKLYYDRLDTKRQTIGKMYLARATLAWNGNKVDGADEIQKFLTERLPSYTSHMVHSFDAQPVADAFVGGQTTLLVQVGGSVQYSANGRIKPFQQNFLVTAEGDHWKVATDTFRTQEVIS